MQVDAVHVVGYAGALGSLLVGGGQLIKILRTKKADAVSSIDYLIRVVSSILLGIYSTSMMDIVFLVVNFGSALLSLAVLGAAWWVKKDCPKSPHRSSTRRALEVGRASV